MRKLRSSNSLIKLPKRKTTKWYKIQFFFYFLLIFLIIFVIVIFPILRSFLFITSEGFVKSFQVDIESTDFAYIERIYPDIGDEIKKGETIVLLRDMDGNEISLKSPFDGHVIDRFKNEFEIVTRGEKIITISDNNYFILAFFKERDFKYLKEKVSVNIFFKDGKKCKGFIKKLYPVIFPINKKNVYFKYEDRFIPAIINLDEKEDLSKYPYNTKVKVIVRRHYGN